MSERRTIHGPSLRRGLLAGAVVFLTLLGSGTATALWSAQQSVDPFTANAATVGVSHSAGTGLAHTYSASALAAAQAVTVTNTGNREAAYSVVVSATSTSDLRSSVTARVAVVANAAACTPSATLSSPVTGPLSPPVTLASAPAALAAGASVTVCVQTAMTGVTGHGGKSLTGSVVSSTVASPQSGWSASTSAITFAQSVATGGTPVDLDGNARYWIRNAASFDHCIALRKGSQGNNDAELVQSGECGDESTHWSGLAEELWRFADTDSGYQQLRNQKPAVNNGPNKYMGVSAAAPGESVRIQTATGITKEWMLVDNGNGTISIQLRANPTLCVAVKGDPLNSDPKHGPGNLHVIACDASSPNQQFVLDMLEIIIPPPSDLNATCSGNGSNYMTYTWPKLAGYENQGDTIYRVLLDGIVLPSSGYSPTPINNWSPRLQFYTDNTVLTAFMAQHGFGSKILSVELSVLGGPWTSVGTGTFVYTSGGALQCGP